MGRATAKVTKEMTATPTRRVGSLSVAICVPAIMGEEDQTRLKNAAMACPVKKSLHPDVQIPVTFVFGKEVANSKDRMT
jgi:putative redox protein